MATPAGTVDSAISSASGAASPPSATSGLPGGGERGHALGPGLPAAEQAQHDEVGAGRQGGHLGPR